MMNNQLNTPKIRFKGYTDAWEQGVLKNVCHITKGEQLGKANMLASGPYYVLNGGMTPSGFTDKYNSKENTISISEGGNSCGYVNWNTEKFWSGGHNYTVYDSKIDNRYLFQYLKAIEDKIMSLRVGSGLPNVQKTRLEELEIKYPNDINEQKAIGDYLFDLDSLLTLHQRKCEKLQAMKKALLEKMFPADGEKMPKIRFKGYTDAWEHHTLSQLGKIETGNTPSTSNSEYYSDEGLLWVTPTDILANITIDTERKLSIIGEKVARVIPPNSILCTCIASIGKNTFVPLKCAFNQQINALTPFENNDPYFLFTNSYHWSQTMKKGAGGLTFQIVNKSEFSSIETCVPKHEEQKKIGLLFKLIDENLTLHQRKCEKLQGMKKALLEKMFA